VVEVEMVSGLGISEVFGQSAVQASRRHLTLADVPVGGKVVIESLPDRTAFGRRLMEIGLLPGSEATVVGQAPLRDPIQVRVLGALIAIRKADALAVHVSPISDGD
jgi:Fe2+ transport system protein FeoA